MAPIDQAYTKMLNDIVLLLVGGIGGIVGKRVAGGVAGSIAAKQPTSQPCQPVSYSPSFSAMPTFVNPEFDETWRAPPPPTTQPDHLHPEREEIAAERAAAKDAE